MSTDPRDPAHLDAVGEAAAEADAFVSEEGHVSEESHGFEEGRDGAESIAVIGYAGRFPGSPDVETYWQHLVAGREQISFFDEEQLVASGVPLEIARDPRYVPARGVMPDPELFDAAFFGLPPREAEVMDPQYRNFLETCWHALENAGHDPRGNHRRCGVYGGSSGSAYLLRNLITRPDVTERAGGLQVRITNDSDFLTTWVSYKLDLGGPSMAVRTACSTSLVAVHLACQGLLDGECDVAMAGGVCVSFPQEVGYLYAEGGIHSPDGHCRTFDAGARGSVEGAGVGVVVLKRLEDALADGDRVRAVIRGTAVNNDGSLKAGYTAPSVDSQSRVIAEALSLAQVDPGTVGFVECHGSGTALGDPIEVEALTRAFRRGTETVGTCALGSAKSAIGHLDAAAGVASLIKAVRAVETGIVPPSLNFETPNPAIDFSDSPFFVPTVAQSWPVEGVPRRAGVSSFGIGGTNVHVVLEEAPPSPPSPPSRRWQPLVLSARDGQALEAGGEAWSTALEAVAAEPDAQLSATAFADVAFTAAAGRHGFRQRWGLVASEAAEALQILRHGGPRRLMGRAPEDGAERPVALLLPGLGDQHVEMGRRLLRDEPIFAAAVERCLEILRPLLADTGLDPREVLFPGAEPKVEDDLAPGEDGGGGRAAFRALVDAGADKEDAAARRLHETLWAHPLTFTIEWALAQTLAARGLRPAAMIGYSLGEYVAATLAGVFSLEDALALVVDRARRVEALAPGALLAVPLAEEELRPVLAEASAATQAAGHGSLALSAINGRSLAVVGGSSAAVDALAQRLGSVGVAARKLRASHAFHTPRLEPMVDGFRQRVAAVRRQPPQIPFVSNATGTWITEQEATDPDYWARHLTRTVRFAEGVQRLFGGDQPALVECGPGQGLSALVRQHGERPATQPVVPLLPDRRRGVSDAAHFEEALVRLWVNGCGVSWQHSWPGEDRHRLPLPGYAFQRRRFFVERDASAAPGAPRRQPVSEVAPAPAMAAAPGASGAELPPLPPSASEVALEEWFQLPGWRLAPPLGRAGGRRDLRAAGPWLLVVPETPSRDPIPGGTESVQGGIAVGTARARALARGLAKQLAEADAEVVTVVLSAESASAGAGLSLAPPASLLAALEHGGVGGPPRKVLFLGPVAASTGLTGPTVPPNLQSALGALRRQLDDELQSSVESLLRLGRGLAEVPRRGVGGEPQEARLSVVTLSAARVTGAEDPLPASAAALGALRVLGQEIPGVHGQGIDLEAPVGESLELWAQGMATRVLSEAARSTPDSLVAWRGGRRWLPSYEPCPLVATESSTTETGSVDAPRACLVIGGHTATGAAFARQLGQRFGARLALVVPPGLPPRSRWDLAAPAEMGPWGPAVERLRSVEASCPELLLIPAALAEEEALERALATARRSFSGLDLVAHCLASPTSGLAQLKELADLRYRWAPKMSGAVALVAALAREAAAAAAPLPQLLLCTSTIAHAGGIGQLETAVGDRFLEALAAALHGIPARRGAPPVRSVAWGTFRWEGAEGDGADGAGTDGAGTDGPGTLATVAQGQRQNLEAFGIDEEALGECLHRVLAHEVEHLAVSPRPVASLIASFDALDTQALLGALAGGGAAAASATGDDEVPEGYGRPDLSTDFRAPESDTERRLTALWEGAFGIQGLGVDDDFFELAGNSLLALQIINRLQAEEGVELPLSALFETPSIAGLAERVEAARERGDAAPSMISGRIPRRPEEESSILSTDQERIYFLQNLAPDSPFYNIYQSERIFGPLNLRVFEAAFDEVVKRHEILRTTFHSVDGTVRQRVREPYRVQLPVFDLSALPRELREREAKRMVTACFQTVFHLDRLPLFQPFLLRMAAQEHIAAELLHHIVIDWISFHAFQSEISRLYSALLKGSDGASALEPLPLQYADYAVWQREQIDSGAWDHHLEFWQQHLRDAPPVTELPVDRPRPAEMGGNGARLDLRLEKDISDSMRQLMTETHTTAFMAAVAIFKVLVLRLSHDSGMCVGSPIANNDREELLPLLGFFINHLVFYSDYGGDPGFRDALGRERDSMVASFAHRETPFAQLVEAVSPPRDLSRVPLTQLCFLMLKPQDLDVPLMPGLDVRANPSDGHSAKFDFNVSLWDAPQGFYGWMEYDTDLFDATTVRRFGAWYRNLWAAAVAEPDRPLSSLSMLSPAQHHQALVEWSSARRRHPEDLDLGRVLEAVALTVPDRPALVWDAPEGADSEATAGSPRSVEWSYGELMQQVDSLAGRLVALGVAPEEPVGVCCERGPELVVALLAVLRAGGAYVPLDPSYPQDRLAFIASDAGCALVLAQQQYVDQIPPSAGRVVALERLAQAPLRQAFRPPPVDPQRLAYLIYTSGTTGKPKGVAIRHGSVIRMMESLGERYSGSRPGHPAAEPTVWSLFHSYAFDFSVFEMWGALGHGGTLVVVPFEVSRSPEAFRELVQRRRVSVLCQTPTAFSQLLAADLASATPALSSVRQIIFGGEALEVGALRPFFDRYVGLDHRTGDGADGESPTVAVGNLWGVTEATVHQSAHGVDAAEAASRGGAPSLIGRPHDDCSLVLLDPHGGLSAPGSPGEIFLGGESLARGYWRRPALTAERFVPAIHPLLHHGDGGGRLYRTGDLARWRSDGALEFLGRNDRQVQIKGFRVELGEVESRLRSHPAVGSAVVVAVDEGSPRARLAAYWVPASMAPQEGEGEGETLDSAASSASQDPVTAAELRAHLLEALPEYMAPATFQTLEALPVTGQGKLDLAALPAPRVERDEGEELSDEEAPQTDVEERLARLWAQVLGVPRVGRHDNFFEIGGDSILSMQLTFRARDEGLLMEPGDVFAQQTVAGLAQVTRQSGEGEDGADGAAVRVAVPSAPSPGPVPLPPVARWTFGLRPPQPAWLNQSVLFAPTEALDEDLLRRALEILEQRHEALRLRWSPVDGARVVEAGGGVAVERLSLASRPPEARAEALERACAQQQGSLDLEQGPVARALLVEGGPGESWRRLLLVVHHLCIDAVSWAPLLDDLARTYGALREGASAVALAAAPAASLSSWWRSLDAEASSAATLAEIPYWLRQVPAETAPWPVDFQPLDPRRPFADVGTTARVSVELEGETTGRLLREVPAASGLRVQEVLLAALGRALAGWRGSSPVMVHVEGHGRDAAALTSPAPGLDPAAVVGWLTSIYPLLLEPTAADPKATLADARDALRAVPRGGLGWGLLRYQLAPALASARRAEESPVSDPLAAAAVETLARRPQPEVAFNYLGRLDRTLSEDSPLQPAMENPGPPEAAANPRRHLLEIDAAVTAAGLRFTLSYSDERHRRETVESLAQNLLGGLRLLVEAALSGDLPPEPGDGDGGGPSPSGPSGGPGALGFAGSGVGGPGPNAFSLDGLTPEARRRLLAGVEDGEDLYPLSPMQEGMLFHDLYDRGSGVYVEQVVGALEGPLDLARFLAAWKQVAQRHGVLRTSFRWRRLERPLQLLHSRAQVPLTLLDLRAAADGEERFDELVAAERHRGFDLDQAPLFRFLLGRVGEQRHRFCWTHHHLLVDGWSLSQVLAEVFTAYAAPALLAAQPSPPPFRRYIQWLEERSAERSREYWRERLEGFAEPSPLPFDREPGSATPDGVGEGQLGLHELVDLPQREAVEALARGHRVTLNTFFQAVWSMLLSRYGAGSDEVLFGVTVSGRPSELEGAESMVGLFINTLPARVAVPSFGEDQLGPWLQRLQAEQAEMRRHEQVPLVEVQGASSVPRGRPLFDSILVFENYPVARALGLEEEDGVGGGEAAPSAAQDLAVVDARTLEVPHYPLSLSIVPALWRIDAAYDGALFDAATVRRMLGHWTTWITALLEAPDTPLHRLPVLSAGERSQVLTQWSEGSGRTWPQEVPLHHLVLRRAAFQPQRQALSWIGEEGELEGWTYGELALRAVALARRLEARHLVASGHGMRQPRVAIYAPRSPQWIVAMLAVLCAGGAYVPLDPQQPPARRRSLLDGAGASALLVGAGWKGSGEESTGLEHWKGEILDLQALLDQDAARVAETAADPVAESATLTAALDGGSISPSAALGAGGLPVVGGNALAYVLFTSGSTGLPKAVAMPHRAVVRLAVGGTFSTIDATAAVAHYAPTAFDASVFEIWGALAQGARLALMPPGELSVEALGRHLLRQQVTHAWLTANLFTQVVAAAPEALRSLRQVVAGGDVLSPSAVDRALALGTPVVNGYGPTETCVFALCRPMEFPRQERGAVPVGRPIVGTRTYVVDRHLRLQPVGAAGELMIGGDGLAWGYWGDPARTAAVFLPDPFGADGARLYRTGDRVRYLANGEVAFLGRLDHQVKIRGFRVEPGEVESALLEHPGVLAGAVGARKDPGGGQRLVAWVVSRSADEGESPLPVLTSEGLLRDLADRLPPFALPSSVVFVEALTHTATGKIDRRALPDPGAPEREPYRAPTSTRQRVLADLFGEILGVDRVGLDDDFFALGGHSLLATRLVSAIYDAYGVELPLRTLFEGRTLESVDLAVAQALEGGEKVGNQASEELAVSSPLTGPSESSAPESSPVGPASAVGGPEEARESAPSEESDATLRDLALRAVDRSRFPEGLPLSSAQRRLWFLERFQPEAKVYNLFGAMRLVGALRLEVASAAVADVVRHQESLRTTFVDIDGSPRQRVSPAASSRRRWTLPVVDLSGIPSASRREAVGQSLLDRASQRPYDLESGPLVRIFVLRYLAPDVAPGGGAEGHAGGAVQGGLAAEHVITFFMHHIISDAWSLGVLFNDFATAYAARSGGSAPRWAPLPLHYGDYAVWQQRRLEAGEEAAHLAFWRDRLAGAPLELALPTDRPRGAQQQLAAASCRRVLPWTAVRSLERLVAGRGGSLFHGLLAVVGLLLRELAGSSDLVLGTTQAGRQRRELEPLVGFFVNTLPLRLQPAPLDSFEEWVGAVASEVLTAFEHQGAPFEQLVEHLAPQRDLSRHPLFQVMVQLQNTPAAAGRLPGLEVRPVPARTTESQFDLTFDFSPVDEGLALNLTYAMALFDGETVERWGKWAQQLMMAALEPGARVGQLSVLSATERRELVEDTGVGPEALAPRETVVESILQRARRQPESPALEEAHADGSTTVMSYGELAREIERLTQRLARRFRALGLEPRNSPVAVRLPPGALRAASLLSVLAAAAPVLPVDPAQPPQRLVTMVRDCGARVLITSSTLVAAGGGELASAVELAGLTLLVVDGVGEEHLEEELDLTPELVPDGDGELIPQRPRVNLRPNLEDVAYLLYTSGSTGVPNGVEVTHEGLARYAQGAIAATAYSSHDRVLQVVSFSFDPTFHELIPPLMAGATVVIPPPEGVEPRELTALVGKLRITLVMALSALLRQWMDEEMAGGGSQPLPRLPLPRLRLVETGGEAMAVEIPGRWSRSSLRGAVLNNLYGPTEAVIAATGWILTPDRARQHEGEAAVTAPIGRPLAGRRVAVVSRAVSLSPPGVGGELWIRDPGLARGYHRRPRLTALRFVPDPWSKVAGGRVYRTGDRVRWRRDGQLEFLGRRDDQVKIRGVRVEVGEVEKALNALEMVEKAAVVVRPDPSGGSRLVAYCVPGGGAESLDETACRRALASQLPAAMIPSLLLPLESLPFTAHDKIDRKALAQLASETQAGEDYVAPEGELETQLAELWQRVLGVEKVGRRDDFFTLGGHSLLATRLLSRVRSELGIDLPVRQLFEEPTVERMARAVEEARRAGSSGASEGTAGPVEGAPGLSAGLPTLGRVSREQRRMTLDELRRRQDSPDSSESPRSPEDRA